MLDISHAIDAPNDGGLLLADKPMDAPWSQHTPARAESALDRLRPIHAPDFLAQALGNTIGLLGTSLYGWRKEDAALLDAFAAPGGTFVNTFTLDHRPVHPRAAGDLVATGHEVASSLGAIGAVVVHAARNMPIRPARMAEPFHATLAWFRPALSELRVAAFTRQLQALFEDEDELKEEDIEPSLRSFVGLLRFTGTASGLKHPNLSLTRAGEFQASWSSGNERRIVMTFEGVVWVRWSAFDRTANQRASGRVALAEAALIVERYGVWMRP